MLQWSSLCVIEFYFYAYRKLPYFNEFPTFNTLTHGSTTRGNPSILLWILTLINSLPNFGETWVFENSVMSSHEEKNLLCAFQSSVNTHKMIPIHQFSVHFTNIYFPLQIILAKKCPYPCLGLSEKESDTISILWRKTQYPESANTNIPSFVQIRCSSDEGN